MKQENIDRLLSIGGRDLLCQVIALFLQHVPTRLETLQVEMAAGNLDAVMRMAHSIKSSAANLGLEDLKALSQQLESLADSGRRTECLALMGVYEDCVQAALLDLDETRKVWSIDETANRCD